MREYCINPIHKRQLLTEGDSNIQSALQEFKPDRNAIDNELYKLIVDERTRLGNADSSDSNESAATVGDVKMVANQQDLDDYIVDWQEAHEDVEIATHRTSPLRIDESDFDIIMNNNNRTRSVVEPQPSLNDTDIQTELLNESRRTMKSKGRRSFKREVIEVDYNVNAFEALEQSKD